MIISLPENILNKKIAYNAISHVCAPVNFLSCLETKGGGVSCTPNYCLRAA